ncbi:unnamed protein product, partial [Closterium sp. NIES-54]
MADLSIQAVDATSAAPMSALTDLLCLDSFPVDCLSDDILGRIFSYVEPVAHGGDTSAPCSQQQSHCDHPSQPASSRSQPSIGKRRDSFHYISGVSDSGSANFDGSYALICRRWYHVACANRSHVALLPERRLCTRRFLKGVASFPSLTSIVLPDGSLSLANDHLLSQLAATCPSLTHFHLGNMAEPVTIRGRRVASTSSRLDHRAAFTESGLASLLSSCARLESLELHCPPNLTSLPPSICGLARLTALKITARGLKRLPDGFRQLSALVSLSIHSEALEKLPAGFATDIDETLETSIRSHDSSISDENAADASQYGARQISSILPHDDNSSLVTSLSHTPSPALPLPMLSALRHLSFDRCRALRALPASLPAALPLLETLELHECALLSAVPACLPARFPRLRALTLAYLPSLRTPLPALLSASPPPAPGTAEEAENGDLSAVSAGENGEPFIEPACKEDAGESSAGLARLELLGWKQMQELPAEALTSLSASLTHITISNCPALSTLPDELCHLPHLRSLTLSFLPLITSLPASLHLLSHSLHHLDITSCDMLQSLPASLTALSSLRSLNVSACGALARLPSAPAALPPARAADREAGAGNGGSGNRIASNSSSSNTTTTTTQAPLPLLPSLTSLRVALCARLTALPRTWMHLPSLQELILDCNGQMESLFDGDDTVHIDSIYYDTIQADTVPPFPSPLPSLHSLSVSDCPRISHLPPFLSRSFSLIHLKLHGLSDLALLPFHNPPNADVTGVALTGTGLVTGAAAAAAVGSDRLEGSGGMIGLLSLHIDLKDNTHITHLPHSLFSLPSLTTLTLSHLSHVASIPHSLSLLAPSLTHLHISHCPLLTALPSYLYRLSSLQSLVIHSCASLKTILEGSTGGTGEKVEGEGGGEGEREREWEGKEGKREEEGEGKEGKREEEGEGKLEVGEVGNVEDMKGRYGMAAMYS